MTGCALVVAAACSNTKVKKKPGGGTAGAFEGGLEAGGGYGGMGGNGGLDAGPDVVDAAQDVAAEAAPPPPPLFFSVSPGAQGQPGTGVAQQTSPASAVYGSAGAAISHTAGSNLLVVSAAQLGLDAGDDIDAIAVKKPVPAHPFYYFSVAGSQSYSMAGDVTFVAQTHEERGDVFLSDGTLFDDASEGDHYFGHNGVFATGLSVGLGPHTLTAGADAGTAGAGGAAAAGGTGGTGTGTAGTGGTVGTAGAGGAAGTTVVDDNLDALEMGVTAANAGTAYFSVTPNAKGAAGSAVAATPANERGCTLYASDRDGKNRVVYSCAELGLEPGDNIDALAVFDLGTGTRVYFSVDQSSQGAGGSVVRSRHDQNANLPTPYAADIYSSDGTSDNQLLVDGTGLGLDDSIDVDGLAVRDVSRPPRYLLSSTCKLTPSPFGDGGTNNYYRLGELSGSLVLLEAYGSEPTAGVYDLSTCKQVGTSATLQTGYSGSTFVAVPRTGWSTAQPLSNLDVWSFSYSFSGVAIVLVQQDASTGQTLATYHVPIANGFYAIRATYLPATKQFLLVGSSNSSENGMLLMDVPQGGSDAGVTTLPSVTSMPTSCSYDIPTAIGVDPASGVLETATISGSFTSPPNAIVCQISPDGYPARPYRSWNDGSLPLEQGIVVPGKALYMTTHTSIDLTVNTFTPPTSGGPADAGPG